MQTLILPILLVVLNIYLAGVVGHLLDTGVGFEFILFFVLWPLVSGIIFLCVHLSQLPFPTKRTTNIIISFVVTLPIYYHAVTAPKYPTREVFDCGHNRKIVFSTSHFCEITCPLYYQVFIGKHEVTPRTFIYLGDYSQEFPDTSYDPLFLDLPYELIVSQDEDLAVIMVKDWPYAPLVMHDFNIQQSWPHQEEAYPELRQRLEQQCPTLSAFAKLEDRAYLTTTSSLDLGYSLIRDHDLHQLQGGQHIRTLSLAHTHITDNGLHTVAKILPTLRELNLEKTAITDNGLNALERFFTHLRRLNLNHTELTDNGLRSLQGSTSLEWLYLDYTRITDDALKSLVLMPNLVYVSLTHTGITDAGLSIFQEVPKDYHVIIDVSHTLVTCEHLKSLRHIFPNIDFRFHDRSCGGC